MHSSVYFVFMKHIIMSLKGNGHFVYDMVMDDGIKVHGKFKLYHRKVNEPD